MFYKKFYCWVFHSFIVEFYFYETDLSILDKEKIRSSSFIFGDVRFIVETDGDL